jgi:hypothetical protein
MARIIEILLVIAPFALFAAWRLLAPSATLTRSMVIGLVALLAVMAGSLVWLRWEEAVPPDAAYVPSRLQNGHILPPDAARP